MEKNKTNGGTALTAKAAASIARRLKVCGHPVRLRLLCAIENRQPCVSDLWHCLGEEQAVVSQHLAVLKRAGIVRSRANGNRRIYSIADPFVKALVGSLAEVRTARGIRTGSRPRRSETP
jgi:DNA-binding transcriptional ArsR family regulator